MSDPDLQILRAALEHHVEVYGRYDLLPAVEGSAAAGPAGAAPAAAARPSTEVPEMTIDVRPPAGSLGPSGPPTSPTADGDPYERIARLIPADSPLRGMQTLAEVSEWVAATELIPLDRVRLNPVFGVGNPDADLMVIGEAPGADEDRQGEPFVGRAGQLLTKILEAIGFARGDVYIANILKSRPPNNRDPLPSEVEAHIPILYRQITLIRPKVLLCVGRTAGNSLLGRDEPLARLRGQFHDFHGLPVAVTYHPAALLRNSQWKRPTWEDVQTVRRRYDELAGATPSLA
jgi:DNA polymerase